MKRTLTLLGLAVISAAASAANVTYRSSAAQLGPLLDALSAQNKVKLKAVGFMSRQVVLVDIKDQPLDLFMRHLATITAGAWTQNGDTYELAESSTALKADEQADIANRAAGFARSIKEQAKTIDAQPINEGEMYRRLADLKAMWDQIQSNPDDPTGAVYEKAQKLQDALPTNQLIRKILVTLPTTELAALPLDSRVVFATSPNRLQRPLPNAAQQALRQFSQDFGMLSAALARFPKEQMEMFTSTMGGFFAKGSPSKILLSCTRYAGDNIAIEAQILDQRGGILATSSANISGMEIPEEGKSATKPVVDEKNEKPLKVSDESKTFYALVSRGMDGSKGGLELVKDPLKEKVLNPEQFDPLSFGISDLLLGAAEDRKKPIIALVPDSAFLYDGGSLKASQFFQQLEDMTMMNIEEKDGWIFGRPSRPSDARFARVNRAAFGQLLRQIYKQGRVNLNNLSTFAIAQGNNPGYDSFYVQVLYSLFGTYMAGYDLSNWEANKFYGYLGEQGRQAIANRVVAFSNLPKDAQNEIAKLVYKQPAIGIGDLDGVGFSTEVSEDATFNPCMDPTERLPNGIPGNSQVRLSLIEEPVVIPATGFGYPMGSAELASQVAMEERPDLFPWAQESKLPDRFRLANRMAFSFDFQFGGNMTYQLPMWDYQVKDNQIFGKGQLPDSFKAEYDKQLKEMREAYKNMKSQNGRGGGAPPPTR